VVRRTTAIINFVDYVLERALTGRQLRKNVYKKSSPAQAIQVDFPIGTDHLVIFSTFKFAAVNSEPHIRTRPSASLCVGPGLALFPHNTWASKFARGEHADHQIFRLA
jgi:hypothetical protein